MLTYKKASELLATARDAGNGKRIANNTRLFDRGGSIAVRLHSTDVVTMYPDGRYVLNNGGWYTATTKNRIHEYAPVRLCQRKGEWYVTSTATGKEQVFENGMTVHAPVQS
jgi:hypothetical protein